MSLEGAEGEALADFEVGNVVVDVKRTTGRLV